MILIKGEYEIQSGNIPNIDIKAFRLYKFRFYGVGFKDIPLKLYTDAKSGKKFFMSGKAKFIGTYIDIYFLALQKMTPIALVVGVIAGVAAVLGLSLIVLKKVQDMSYLLLPLALIPLAIVYRKEIKKSIGKL